MENAWMFHRATRPSLIIANRFTKKYAAGINPHIQREHFRSFLPQRKITSDTFPNSPEQDYQSSVSGRPVVKRLFCKPWPPSNLFPGTLPSSWTAIDRK